MKEAVIYKIDKILRDFDVSFLFALLRTLKKMKKETKKHGKEKRKDN